MIYVIQRPPPDSTKRVYHEYRDLKGQFTCSLGGQSCEAGGNQQLLNQSWNLRITGTNDVASGCSYGLEAPLRVSSEPAFKDWRVCTLMPQIMEASSLTLCAYKMQLSSSVFHSIQPQPIKCHSNTEQAFPTIPRSTFPLSQETSTPRQFSTQSGIHVKLTITWQESIWSYYAENHSLVGSNHSFLNVFHVWLFSSSFAQLQVDRHIKHVYKSNI